MKTIDSLSEEYATYLLLNRNDPNVAGELAKRINKLTYTEIQDRHENGDERWQILS